MVADEILVCFPLVLRMLTVKPNLRRVYMADGFYQSVICFFLPYNLYAAANLATENGRDITERARMGVLIGTCAVLASNAYILLNTYRWDWFTCLINLISSFLIFVWTGIYTSFTQSGTFYQAASEVYGALSYWVVLLLTVTICLLPRFTAKAIQKVFFPRDVDIIREQVTLGKFKFLDKFDDYVPPKAATIAESDESATSSDLTKPVQPVMKQAPVVPDDERPFYPPSLANTHNPRSQNGSNGTNYSASLDQCPMPQAVDNIRSHERARHSTRHSFERSRQSFDRSRPSFDRNRQSFERSNDFTSAAMLARMESTHSNDGRQDPFRSPNEPPDNMI